ASTGATSQIKSASAEIERTIAVSTDRFGSTLNGKVEAITDGVREQTEQLSQLVDSRRGALIEALGSKAAEISSTIGSAADSALKSIENHGGAFTVAMMNNSSDLARQINTASEIAIGAVSKSLKDIDQTSRAAIDQSRQVATSTINELQETSKILRTDTLALFERLREGNILLQEVLTGAHDNLNSLERTLVTRVAEFVSTMNDVTNRNGDSTNTLEQQLGTFTAKTSSALENLNALSSQFENHGRALAEAATLVERSNERAGDSVADRNAMLESLVSTIDLRTHDLDERLSRFTNLLDDSLAAAETRARDIAQIVAQTAGSSSAEVSRQFEAVRMAVEDERRQTSEAMAELYDQGTREAENMFRQAADKFATIVHGMKQMASELHGELDATRAELRRGVLEVPQEAAESTAQMRKVIVDQIEALAELNRIVARHGKGLDVAPTTRTVYREEELAAAGGRTETASRPAPAPRPRDVTSASSLPAPEFGPPGPAPRRTEAPSVSPVGNGGNNDGWLSDLLNRSENDDSARNRAAPRQSANPLEALSLDIARLLDRELAAEMWDRYQRGERKAFSKRLYTPAGQKAFDEVSRKYRSDRNFKQTVDRYINEFERLLDEVSRDERGPAALRSHLVSETGLVYTLLAHAAGRLG
ncbi:MAG: methyl-accepting chemotaxis protein, partial [Pseudomonadota bacterium]